MTADEPLHLAARIETRVHNVVERRLRTLGWTPSFVSYPGYGSGGGDGGAGWVRLLGRVVLGPPGAPKPADGDPRGWRRFLSSSGHGVTLEVELCGRRTRRLEVVSDRDGYVDARFELADPGELPAGESPGWHLVRVRVKGSEHVVEAPVRVVTAATRVGVVSDLDDTVIVTMLPRPLTAFRNAFVERESARRPVPGMAELYAEVLRTTPDALVAYVSTGAWNTVVPMRDFLQRHGFPAGPMLMTDWGPTATGWFRSGQEHKRSTLRRLLSDLPHVDWLLVGDDGQHDPSTYAELRTELPDRVLGVAIRELSAVRQVVGHGAPVPPDGTGVVDPELPGDPVTGPDGHVLAQELRERGILPLRPRRC